MAVQTIEEMGEDAVYVAMAAVIEAHNREMERVVADMAAAEESRRTTHGCWIEVEPVEYWYITGRLPMLYDASAGRYRDHLGRFILSRYGEARRIFARAGVRMKRDG